MVRVRVTVKVKVNVMRLRREGESDMGRGALQRVAKRSARVKGQDEGGM